MGVTAMRTDTLRELLCEELEQYEGKRDLSRSDLETVHKLTDTYKNLLKIESLEEDDGYSRTGEWEADMRGRYGRGDSYRARHYVRGHYSREDGKERMLEKIDRLMQDAPDRDRDILRRCKEQLERE